MARNGSGTFTKAVSDFVAGTTASATDMNTLIDDIANEITNSVDKDGQTVYTGSHDWNGNLMITDADGDSKIGSSADDQFDVTLASTINHKLTTSGYEFAAISNPTILGKDTDGVLTLSPNTASLGGVVKLYGDTHATKAGDIEFYDDASIKGFFDASAGYWDFDNIDGTVIGATTPAAGTFTTLTGTTTSAGALTATSITIGAAGITEAELEILDGATITTTELNYLSGVSSAIQTQLNKPALIYLSKDDVGSPASGVNFNNTVFDGTYEEYEIRFHNVIPSTDGQVFQFLTSTDNGSTMDSSYDWLVLTNTSHTNTGDSSIALTGTRTIGNGTNEMGVSGIVVISRPASAIYTLIRWNLAFMDSAAPSVTYPASGAAVVNSATDVDYVRFRFASGNIASGKFAVYGIKRS